MSGHTAGVAPPSAPPRTGFPYLDAVLDQPGSVLAMAHRGGATHPDLGGLEDGVVGRFESTEHLLPPRLGDGLRLRPTA